MFPRHDVNSAGDPAGTPGYVCLTSESDAGMVTTQATNRQIDSSPDYRLRVAVDSVIFQDQFTASSNTVNSKWWKRDTTGMAPTFSNGFAIMNNPNSTTANDYCYIKSYRTFGYYSSFPLYCHFHAKTVNGNATNKVMELGLGYSPDAAGAVTDGVFFRWAADGKLYGVVNFNGSETTVQCGALNGKGLSPTDTNIHYFIVEIYQNQAWFWVDQVIQCTIPLPAAQAFIARGLSGQLTARMYNSGTASAAAQLQVAMMGVTLGDSGQGGKKWSHTMAGMGRNSACTQNGTAAGMTAAISNSTIPTAGSLSNTAALVTGLGGFFQANAPTGAANDYIVTSYQNPAGSATYPGQTLHITGCNIDCINYGAAVATTPTTLMWMIGWDGTAVTMATTDSSTTRAYLRKAIGNMYVPVGAAIGVPYTGPIRIQFESSLVIAPGGYINSLVKIPVGTNTASQTILGSVDFDGYWEL